MPTARSSSPSPRQMVEQLYVCPAVPEIARPLLRALMVQRPNAPISRDAQDVLDLLWLEHILPQQQQAERLAASVDQRLDSLVARVAASVATEEKRRAADAADPLLPCSCGLLARDCTSDVLHREHYTAPRLLSHGPLLNPLDGEPPEPREPRIVPSFRTTELPPPEPEPDEEINSEIVLERTVALPIAPQPRGRR